ncbi:putative coil containing protein [Vibrio phage 236O40-1]|nr:putative coil containing protein [Vibrio phage 236O40-1]
MTDRAPLTAISAPIGAPSDLDDLAVHLANEQQGGLKFFKTNVDRDDFTKKYKSRLFKSVSLSMSGENNYPSFYLWTGTQKDGSDGGWQFISYAGGFVLGDADGGIPHLVSTLIASGDFSIQSAGDSGKGAMLALSDGIKQALQSHATGDGLITVGTYQKPTTFGKGNIFELEWPLTAWPDADKEKAFRVSMDHSAFEPLHKPGFLAYLSYGEEVIGKEGDGAKGHHDGAIWFDEIAVPTNAYISSDMPTKSYTIEEADNLDPNVSGGTDYLMAFRVGLKGNAPDDGFVRIYIYDKSINPFMKNGYMEDVNGQPMVIERHYKQGDKLGFLDIIGVVNAKGQQGFSCHVVDNFTDDTLNITDPYYGETALMIQALASNSRTGLARLQYQQDTQQRIIASSRYVGEDLFSLAYFAHSSTPMTTSGAGRGQTQTDGVHFYNVNPMSAGVVDNHVVLKDDGTNICDFSFGKIFDAELTSLIKGKEVVVKTEITNKDNGVRVYLIAWKGDADKYTPEIFTSRNNEVPNWQANWVASGNSFIAEDVSHEDVSHEFTFTVPSDSKNFAVVIVPATAEEPCEIKIKSLEVDAADPFNAYSMQASEMIGEQRGVWNPENFLFTQDTQGFASLRYTINKTWTTMPIGIASKEQNQDISIDPSKNKISGSSAMGGEGVIKFNKEGLIGKSSYVDFFAWNEQGVDSDLTVRIVMADPDSGTFDPDNKDLYIAEGGITVPANSKGSKHLFHIPEKQVEQGEVWGIFAKSNKDDGAFLQCVSNKNPLMQVSIRLKKLDTISYSMYDEGGGGTSALVKY